MNPDSPPQPYFKPDAQPNFTHKPLPTSGKVFRLLTLLPGQGNEPLHASLTAQSLDAQIEYEALSYMWGSPEPKQLLRVDDQDFLLRPNIYSLLLRLRSPSRSRVVWLDSVCIDQNNTDERSSQVALMGDIYRSCRQCIVWLGEADDRGDEVLVVFGENPVDERGMTDLNNLVRILYQRGLTQSFRKLLKNPYWTRVWMIQETTLPETVIVHCGQSSCGLDQIPTQVRELMFEVFQQNRMQYQQWIKIFSNWESMCSLLDLPTDHIGEHNTENEMFPFIVGHIGQPQQDTYLLGFIKAQDRRRLVPVVVELQDVNARSIQVHNAISLSSVSGLSFAYDEFDAVEAFRAIESVFWCISETGSEQLLDERRRHTSANNRQFSSVDFRNYLETTDSWYCTDVRDRVFGALGVFEIWPQPHPYRADYHLSASDVLVSVVDYCRPTDPFKLAIKLLSALSTDTFDVEKFTTLTSVTIMSRISWPLSLFRAESLTVEGNDRYLATRLHRLDVPTAAQAFVYFALRDDPPQPTDEIISIGDASMVLGVRKSSAESSWHCVGIGIDAQPGIHQDRTETDRLPSFGGLDHSDEGLLRELMTVGEQCTGISEHESVRKTLDDLAKIKIRKAGAEDEGVDGTPVLWWTTIPTVFFWYVCRREKRRREVSNEESGFDQELNRHSESFSDGQMAISREFSQSQGFD